MKLAIISHTEHYRDSDGNIVGWGPTVTEINHLTEIFDEIYHVAMLHDHTPPPSALPYTSDKIKFIPLPPVGGRTLGAKMSILAKAPRIITTVQKVLKHVDYFQLRTPTGIGVLIIPYLSFSKRRGWFKYAGNWNQKNPPLGYGLQRWMLKVQNRKVTINGKWPNQPSHCLSFENPCLSELDLDSGRRVRESKTYDNKLSFCFVGRLEHEKGVGRIIKAISNLSTEEKGKIEVVHCVGDGKERDSFLHLASHSGVKFKFHGYLPRNEVFSVYKMSHIFLLPSSASEGFPKVIAEALNFGCIPIVSDVSSIKQYISHGENGFILQNMSENDLTLIIQRVLNFSLNDYSGFFHNVIELSEKFSYAYYNKRIKSEILGL